MPRQEWANVVSRSIRRSCGERQRFRHQLARIDIFASEPEALDRLEPLLKIPYYVSLRLAKIDRNFAALGENPRFRNSSRLRSEVGVLSVRSFTPAGRKCPFQLVATVGIRSWTRSSSRLEAKREVR